MFFEDMDDTATDGGAAATGTDMDDDDKKDGGAESVDSDM